MENESYFNLFVDVSGERMQSESRNLEHPTTVDVTVGAGQVAVRLERRLVQVNHSLAATNISWHRSSVSNNNIRLTESEYDV